MLKSPFLAEISAITRFTGRFFREGFRPRYEVRELLYQCYAVGYQSLPMVGVTGFIMGLVLTLQSRPTSHGPAAGQAGLSAPKQCPLRLDNCE